MPPVRSRRAAAFSWPVPTTGLRHERRVPALGGIHSGVHPGRILPVWNPGRKGRREGRKGGQDKGNRHYAGCIFEFVIVCTLVRRAASGTLFLDGASRDFAQSLGFAGFRPAPWPPIARFSAILAGGASMSADDENRFRPKPGRIRADAPKLGKTKSLDRKSTRLNSSH